jgi:glycosyltransferase involved in cell wall biosynthesis
VDARRVLGIGSRVIREARVLFGVSDVISANTFLKEFVADTQARGAHVRWFAGGVTAPAPTLVGTFVHVPSLVRNISIKDDLGALRTLVALMKREHPTAVHLSTPKAALLGMMAAAWCRVPRRVYMLRGLRLETSSGPSFVLLWLLEWLTGFLATEIVCVSHSVAKRTTALHLASSRKITVLGEGSSCGVITQRFAPSAERSEVGREIRHRFGIDDDRIVIGYVGRVNASKGVEDLLMAFAESRKEHQVDLLVVGDLEPGEPLTPQAVEVLNGGDHVHWQPFVTDTSPYYHAFDMFVLATYREGFPNVVLEAGSAGLAVITTDATGAVDSVVPNVTGLMVKTGNVAELTKAIAELAEDGAKRRRLGDAARQRCAEVFEREKVVLRHVDHLVGHIGGRAESLSSKGSM